jgi:phenylacetate-coenzyme A ligase PaaK-like adenylate-forming protein
MSRRSIEEIMARRQARLHELVAFARANSPYYAQHYRGVPESSSDVQELPPTEKRELMSHFDEWVTDKAVTRTGVEEFIADLSRIGQPYLNKYLVCTTSGSTGTPAILLHDSRWMVVNNGLNLARISRQWFSWRHAAKVRQGFRYGLISATHSHFYGMTMVEFQRRHPQRQKTNRIFSIFTPLPQLVDQLNEFQPEMLNSYPTMLTLLVKEQLAGRLNIHPFTVYSSGETLDPEAGKQMESAWGTRVYNLYVASETGYIGFQCRRGQMHVNADWLILEPLDQQDRPVSPGEPSHSVLVTNLANRIQPIIRYKMGDCVTVSPTPCSCGSSLPVIRVQGRNDEILTVATADGQTLDLLPAVLRTAMDKIPGLHRWQIIQKKPTQLDVRLEVSAGEEIAPVWTVVQQRLHACLAEQGLPNLTANLSPEPPHPNPSSGKFRKVYADISN